MTLILEPDLLDMSQSIEWMSIDDLTDIARIAVTAIGKLGLVKHAGYILVIGEEISGIKQDN